jgi:hypothetical protein
VLSIIKKNIQKKYSKAFGKMREKVKVNRLIYVQINII